MPRDSDSKARWWRQLRRYAPISSIAVNRPVVVGLTIRLLVTFALPALLDDGLLLHGVRYTDIDYDVFSDAAEHVAAGRSPYARHTYRYTPFLAWLLALPLKYREEGAARYAFLGARFLKRHFGKLLFCAADVFCGHIIVLLRRRKRSFTGGNQYLKGSEGCKETLLNFSPELTDALWWLYNPLPINICTRGSAESLVVLLPVLATVAVAEAYQMQPPQSSKWRGVLPILTRACVAGALHGIGIHAKLFPVIYTVSFMANFSRQQQQRCMVLSRKNCQQTPRSFSAQIDATESHTLSKSGRNQTFPWRHPKQILVLAIFWVQRLLFTLSSLCFLLFSMLTFGVLTYLSIRHHGLEALDEGLLYHFKRVDHRHNYSMYWYWIYLARGRAEVMPPGEASGAVFASAWGYIPVLPQALVLGFSSLGVAPYDLSFALFCQTFAFVAFNKVITAQYFVWYLCLLPLCSARLDWSSKQMRRSICVFVASIAAWLLSAFLLEMLGWRLHRQVWAASLFYFLANVNLLCSILMGYKSRREPKFLSRFEGGCTANLHRFEKTKTDTQPVEGVSKLKLQ